MYFYKDFYGNVYTPSVSLSDPTIQELTDYIWNNRASNLRHAGVIKSEPYLKCCARFSLHGNAYIEEAVKEMIEDVRTFESHDYIAKDDKIAYKDQTNIEHAVGKISLKSLQENIKINIKCGSFSYAEIPKQFSYFMGVTGTLKTLSDPEKAIVSDVFGIKKKTFMPSVFGKNNLNPNMPIFIENKSDYSNTIVREIKKVVLSKRAVLVFFENDKNLMDFYKNAHALQELKIKYNVYYLAEDASSQEKDFLVRKAAVSGRINLLSRSFGRGTDFICYDSEVINNGGIHVLQTFLSEELSEETQIKGRTARQGGEGSYSMVLLNESLEKFLITLEDIENFYRKGIFTSFVRWVLQTKTPSVYSVLDERRTVFFKEQFKRNDEFVVFAKNQHEKAAAFLKSLFAQDMTAVQEFLKSQNQGVEEEVDQGHCA